MKPAMQYRTWSPSSATSWTGKSRVQQFVSENALIGFANPGCFMFHVAKHLLLGLGVNPVVEEVDETEQATVSHELSTIAGFGDEESGEKLLFPAFFVGGKYFGGLEKVMAMHISGELVPVLREAGALWL